MILPPPRNLRELLAYLTVNPYVRMSCPDPRIAVGRPGQDPERFVRHDEGLLWWRNAQGVEHHFPLACGLPPAAGHESGLDFDVNGFRYTKFGITITVTYVSEPMPREPHSDQLP